MVDVFADKICSYCSKESCSKRIKIVKEKNYTTYKCDEYERNKNKIIPYQEPLIITAERNYLLKKER